MNPTPQAFNGATALNGVNLKDVNAVRAALAKGLPGDAAPGTIGKRAILVMQARISAAVAQLGLFPSALQGALRERFYDLLSNHRLAVLKRHSFPAGRAAQKMLATRMFRYTKATNPALPANVTGEGYVAELNGNGGDWGDYFHAAEFGGTRVARSLRIVPLGRGRKGGKPTLELLDMLKRKSASLIRANGRLLVVKHVGGRRARSEILGMLTPNQKFRQILGFRREFDGVASKHIAKVERDVDTAMTAAGQEALERRNITSEIFNESIGRELRKILASSPQTSYPKAMAAARRAARSVVTEYKRTARAGGA